MTIYVVQTHRKQLLSAVSFARKALTKYLQKRVGDAGEEHSRLIRSQHESKEKALETLEKKLKLVFEMRDAVELDEIERSLLRSAVEIYAVDLNQKVLTGVGELKSELKEVKKILRSELTDGADGTLLLKYHELTFFKQPFVTLADAKTFTPEYVKAIHKKFAVDELLIQKGINALEILARLYSWGFNATFKGGTATQLLLPEGTQRMSIDLDFTTNENEEYVENVLDALTQVMQFTWKKWPPHPDPNFEFVRYELTVSNLIPSSVYIDVTFKELEYNRQKTLIKTFYYQSLEPVYARTPTLSSLLGDKLTTLGPHTIGRSLERDPLSCAKDLFDIVALIDHAESIQEIHKAYRSSFSYQKKIRPHLKDLPLQTAFDDLLYCAELFSMNHAIPVAVKEQKTITDTHLIEKGMNDLSNFLTEQNRPKSARMAREGGGKIALIEKLLELQEKSQAKTEDIDSILKAISLAKNKATDPEFLKRVQAKLEATKISKAIYPKEMAKAAPLALAYWYGYYYPKEFLEEIK